MSEPTVAVLFTRADSIYRTIPGCDCYDIERDARNYAGPWPVVAHPPCRAWGKLAHFAKPRPDEMDLARFAVRTVRQFGGVLEHPFASRLWQDQGLPRPGERDEWGAFSLAVPQVWFGHRADKPTILYVVGSDPAHVPEMPFTLAPATHVIGSSSVARGRNKGTPGYKLGLSKNNRERTPPAFARWLVELARLCHSHE